MGRPQIGISDLEAPSWPFRIVPADDHLRRHVDRNNRNRDSHRTWTRPYWEAFVQTKSFARQDSLAACVTARGTRRARGSGSSPPRGRPSVRVDAWNGVLCAANSQRVSPPPSDLRSSDSATHEIWTPLPGRDRAKTQGSKGELDSAKTTASNRGRRDLGPSPLPWGRRQRSQIQRLAS